MKNVEKQHIFAQLLSLERYKTGLVLNDCG